MVTLKSIAKLALLSMFLALPTITHAAPPTLADFSIPISARHIDNWGVGFGLAWQSPVTGFMVTGDVTYDRIDGASGAVTVPMSYDKSIMSGTHPRPPRTIPFTTPDSNVVGVTLTMHIPLCKVPCARH